MFKNISSGNIELLKWFAILFMIIDHTGYLLFNKNEITHIIGRIAFPLFAFLLVHNYLYFTKDKKLFLKRLFIFGLISQPIYYIVMEMPQLNIFFTLFLGMLFIFIFEKISVFSRNKVEKIFSLFFLILIIGLLSLFVDYTFFGIGLIISFYFSFIYKNLISKGSSFIFCYLSNSLIIFNGLFSLISFIILKLITLKEVKMKRMNKWFFYGFYPMHLIILFIIK